VVSVSGEIHVLGVTTLALLDSGATHSFIASAFTQRMGITSESLGMALAVMVPSGEELTTTSVVQGLMMMFQDHAVQADLVVLPMSGFDLIPRHGLVDGVRSSD
ncbi:hypothetical protein F511_43739, partial [Dorcoceras hygrometricum]